MGLEQAHIFQKNQSGFNMENTLNGVSGLDELGDKGTFR